MKDSTELEQYVIYERPLDYPEHYVVRRFRIIKGTKIVPDDAVIVCQTLEEARERVPYYLNNIGRMAGDQAQIREIWA